MLLVDDGGRVARTPPPPPPPPPAPNPAAQRSANERISRALDGGVDRDEVRVVIDTLNGLSSTDADAVIGRMAADGSLKKLAGQSVDESWFGGGRLSSDELRSFFVSASRKLNGAGLAKLSDAYRAAGDEHALALADAVAAHGSKEVKLEYIGSITGVGRLTDDRPRVGEVRADLEARAVGRVLASMRGAEAYEGFATLGASERQAVFAAAADLSTTAYPNRAGVTRISRFDSGRFGELMTAVRSIEAPASSPSPYNPYAPNLTAEEATARFRGSVVGEAVEAIKGLRPQDGAWGAQQGLGADQAGEMARMALNALDSRSVSYLPPDQMPALADMLAKDPKGPGEAMRTLQGFAPSQARDALIRTIFLKTPGDAYTRGGNAALETARALAQTLTTDPARAETMAQEIAQTLNTPEGRSLLSDQNVNADARLVMLNAFAEDPARVRNALSGAGDKAWESPPVLEMFARARVEQFSAARGNVQLTLQGGTDFENFIGASLGAPTRSDLPQTESDLQAAQAAASRGAYNFYQGVEAVQKPADGMREAQSQMGGGPVSVSVLPVQFSSQATGPVDLQIYRVEGANGQSRYVDNTGRVYSDFNAWTNENKLPPGKMTFAAGGQLSETGQTRLETRNTPDTADTFWEHIVNVADVAALVGGVIASGVIIVASGGTATPLVAGAWVVAGGSALWAGGRAVGDLMDRRAHGQTLSLTDADARAAWLSVAGSALTVGGMGAMRLATLAGNGTRLSANTARAAGILNTSANYADAAATVDTAQNLVRNWDQLTPAQRTQMGLSIAFWGGMTGVSARVGGGRATDAFDFRTQVNQAMIASGAAITARSTLAGDAVAIGRDPATGRITIEHGPDATPESLRIHQDVAQLMASDQSLVARMQRFVTQNGEPGPPGTAGWETRYEIEKLSREISQLGADISRGNLNPAQHANAQERLEQLQTNLARHEADLARMVRDPGLGRVEAPNTHRIAVRPDASLGANEATLARVVGADGRVRYEVRHGAGLTKDSQDVLLLRRTAAELTANDNSLAARRNAARPGTPGSAAAEADRLVSARANAADRLVADLAAAPNQARRNEITVQALHSYLQSGREANLIYDAIRADPSLAPASRAQVIDRLRADAASGGLMESQVDNMARLGWLCRIEVQAARQRMGLANERIFDSVEALNQAADRAAPFTHYTLVVRNGAGAEIGRYTWETDHLGRTVSVVGAIPALNADRRNGLQRRIGNEAGLVNGLPEVPNGAHSATDVGFHIIAADAIAGPTNHLNVVPGDATLNNSQWKTQFESLIKNAAATGQRVEVRIIVDYGQGVTRRPEAFIPEYRVDGGDWLQAGRLPNH